MIEMDMRKQQPIDILTIHAEFVERGEHRGHGMGGATIDESGPTRIHDEMDGIEEGHQIFGIDGMDAVIVTVGDHRPPSAAALES
jgi:hypothetical protein